MVADSLPTSTQLENPVKQTWKKWMAPASWWQGFLVMGQFYIQVSIKYLLIACYMTGIMLGIRYFGSQSLVFQENWSNDNLSVNLKTAWWVL